MSSGTSPAPGAAVGSATHPQQGAAPGPISDDDVCRSMYESFYEYAYSPFSPSGLPTPRGPPAAAVATSGAPARQRPAALPKLAVGGAGGSTGAVDVAISDFGAPKSKSVGVASGVAGKPRARAAAPTPRAGATTAWKDRIDRSPAGKPPPGGSLTGAAAAGRPPAAARAAERPVEDDSRPHSLPHHESVPARRRRGSLVAATVQLGDQHGWNKAYQTALETVYAREAKTEEATAIANEAGDDNSDDEELVEAYTTLSRLARDFVAAATQYGRIIISERFLPAEAKTIRPANVGGIAGGEKFVVRGWLFKFAVDSKGLYGSDALAAKVAGHELRGLAALHGANVHALSLPLCATIDHMGWRLLAVSLLPVHGVDTLRYGSANQGRTVLDNDALIHDAMEEAATKLNLAAHRCGAVTMYGPADIEGHAGEDGRAYVIDVARLFPPERPAYAAPRRAAGGPPDSPLAEGTGGREGGDNKSPRLLNKLSHLTQQLRPELVATFSAPLSSDAYSWFGMADHELHNGNVDAASEHLRRVVIPDFARKVVRIATSVTEGYPGNLRLLHRMHHAGINARHLARVLVAILQQCDADGEHTHPSTAVVDCTRVLFVEMAARAIKHEWRRRLRESLAGEALPGGEELAKATTIRLFNECLPIRLFKHRRASWRMRHDSRRDNKRASAAWDSYVLPNLTRMFFDEELDAVLAARATAVEEGGGPDVSRVSVFTRSRVYEELFEGLGLRKVAAALNMRGSRVGPFWMTDRSMLFARLCQMLGLVFSPDAIRRCNVEVSEAFHDTDLLRIEPVVKTVKIVDAHSTGKVSLLRALSTKGGQSARVTRALLERAVRNLGPAGMAPGADARVLIDVADAFFEYAIRARIGESASLSLDGGVDTPQRMLKGARRVYRQVATDASASPNVVSRARRRLRHLTRARAWLATTSHRPYVLHDDEDDGSHAAAAAGKGHVDRVYAVQQSADGRFLFSGSKDTNVCVWDLEAIVAAGEGGRPAHPVVFSDSGHVDWVRDLAYDDETGILLSAGDYNDGTVRFWGRVAGVDGSDSTWRCVFALVVGFKIMSIELLRVRTPFPVGTPTHLLVGCHDGLVRLYDVRALFSLLLLSMQHPGARSTLRQSAVPHSADQQARGAVLLRAPAEAGIALDASSPAEASDVLRQLERAQISSGVTLQRRDHAPLAHVVSRTSETCVFDVSLNDDHTLLATAAEDHTACVWDVTKLTTGGAAAFMVRLGVPCSFESRDGHVGTVSCARWPPYRSDVLATGSFDRTARLWEVATGACLRVIRGHTDGLWCAAWLPFHRAGGLDDSDDGSGDVLRGPGTHGEPVVEVEPLCDVLLTGSSDGSVRAWSFVLAPRTVAEMATPTPLRRGTSEESAFSFGEEEVAASRERSVSFGTPTPTPTADDLARITPRDDATTPRGVHATVPPPPPAPAAATAAASAPPPSPASAVAGVPRHDSGMFGGMARAGGAFPLPMPTPTRAPRPRARLKVASACVRVLTADNDADIYALSVQGGRLAFGTADARIVVLPVPETDNDGADGNAGGDDAFDE